MITAINNNFGAESFSLKCYNSPDIIVLEGVISIDPANENYLAAEQLEITFDTDFAHTDDNVSQCYLIAGNGVNTYGTTLKCRITGTNTLAIEKLSIFDDQENVRIMLGTAFIPSDSSVVLQTLKHTETRYFYQYHWDYWELQHHINHFGEQWGCMAGITSRFSYKQGQDNVMQFYDLADEYKNIDITIPMFYNDQYKNSNTPPYTQCRLIRFADGKMTLTGEEGSSTSKTQYPMFYSYFFVRDAVVATEGTETETIE